MGGEASTEDYSVVWEPQPGPQTALLECPIFEVFFGGARGGGKTDGVLGEWVSHAAQYGVNAIGLMVRRSLVELTETIERSKKLFTLLGATYNGQEKMWRFPDGARLRFAYLENDSDAEGYQGHSYTRVYVEELGNFPNPAPIMKLIATLRSAAGVPCGFRATGNPGGPGHTWIQARYIDPAPGGYVILEEEFKNPWNGDRMTRERVFIPSKVTDNRYLGADYIANLQMSGSPELVRAWLEGDWNVIAGAYFPELSFQRHALKPFPIPHYWFRFRSFDWGGYRPFSVGWWAVADGTEVKHGDASTLVPRGSVIRYREWYGWNGKPNEGLGLKNELIASGIKEKTPVSEKISYTVTDSLPFKAEGGPPMAETFRLCGVPLRRGDVKPGSRVAGWQQVRSRLVGIDGKPLIYAFDTCPHFFRTLAAMQHDERDPEDVDSDGEDHCPDEVRLACMSRPFIRKSQEVLEPKGINDMSLNDLFKANEQMKRRMRR